MKIHFIAIGGAIMHQLALALYRKGFEVTGSDDEIQDPARKNLQELGLLPSEYGWFPERIHIKLDAVVLGMHARPDNPELQAAKALNIPIYSFPEYVYNVSKDKQRVVVAGSHGKTTVTSMVMHILRKAGQDFDYLVGAAVRGFNQSVKISDDPVIVLEGDEYPASAIEKKPKIFFYHPQVSLITGIAWDHINVFPTYNIYKEQFAIFIRNLEKDSLLIYNQEDPELVGLVEDNGEHLRLQPYETPDYQYSKEGAQINYQDRSYPLAVFGKHNFQNMMGAVEIVKALGMSPEAALESLRDFEGAARRLEQIAAKGEHVVFRDFAHAPSKLKATLTAVREAYPEHRLIALYELHTYSSFSEEFLEGYANSMKPADQAAVYFSEKTIRIKQLPVPEYATIRAKFEDQDLAVFSDPEAVSSWLQAQLQVKDQPVCLLLMSSGTYDGIDWIKFSNTFL